MQFSQLYAYNPSSCINRGHLIMPTPYIHLGFNQLMQDHQLSKQNTLDDTTSLECIAHMGRPL